MSRTNTFQMTLKNTMDMLHEKVPDLLPQQGTNTNNDIQYTPIVDILTWASFIIYFD